MTSNPETAGVGTPYARLIEAISASIGESIMPGAQWWKLAGELRERGIDVVVPPAAREDGGSMAAFAASDVACVYFPGDGQQAERVAFQRGAEYASRGPDEGEAVRLLRAFHAADDARNDCSECENEGPWEHCGSCSDRIGEAINDQLLFLATTRPAPEQAHARNLSASADELIAQAKPLVLPECMACEDKPAAENNPCAVCSKQAPDHANCAVGEELVAKAIVEEIGWGAFDHFDPADIRRIARAAVAAMPTSEAIRADERARVVAIMRDVIRSFQECDGYELAGQMRIRLAHLTGGGE